MNYKFAAIPLASSVKYANSLWKTYKQVTVFGFIDGQYTVNLATLKLWQSGFNNSGTWKSREKRTLRSYNFILRIFHLEKHLH